MTSRARCDTKGQVVMLKMKQKLSMLPFQVLADQAVWAVCGRAAAVVDMTLATEVKSKDG